MLDLCHDSAKLMLAWLSARCSISYLNAVESGSVIFECKEELLVEHEVDGILNVGKK